MTCNTWGFLKLDSRWALTTEEMSGSNPYSPPYYRHQHWIHPWKPLINSISLGTSLLPIKLFLLENHHCLLAKRLCKLEGERLDTSRHIPSLKQGPVNIRRMHEWVAEWMKPESRQATEPLWFIPSLRFGPIPGQLQFLTRRLGKGVPQPPGSDAWWSEVELM